MSINRYFDSPGEPPEKKKSHPGLIGVRAKSGKVRIRTGGLQSVFESTYTIWISQKYRRAIEDSPFLMIVDD